MNNKPFYNFSADVVRVVAITGVILIHTTNAVYTRLDFMGGATWWIAIILDSLSRISIPLFIMLSGYLLLRKDEAFPRTLKRIFLRIGLPLMFWVPFYFWLGTGTPSLNHINLSIFQKLFYGDVYHLYFLVIIIGLYFVAPILRSYIRNSSVASLSYLMKLLLFLGLTQVVLQFIFQSCTSENFFTRWVPYAGLFVAGYVLGNSTEKWNSKKLFLIYSAALLTTIGFNYLHYTLLTNGQSIFNSPGCLSHYTDHYVSLNVVAMSLSAFVILLRLKHDRIKNFAVTNKLVQLVARASFGMYILQPVVARFLEIQFHLAVDFSTLPIAAILFTKLFLVFIITYAMTITLSKIPVVRLVLGVGR